MFNLGARLAFSKAGISYSDLGEGSRLQPDQWSEFVSKVRESATMRNYVTVAGIDKAGKMFIPSIEAPPYVIQNQQGLKNPADYAMTFLNFSEHSVQTYDVETIVFVPRQFTEGNFKEKNGLTAALGLLGEQFAANLEEMGLFSNTLGPAVLESDIRKDGASSQYIKLDAFSNYNGWLETMESGVVIDAENSDDLHGVFGEALLNWPTRYDKYMQGLRFFTPTRLKTIAQINLGNDPTQLGALAKNGSIEIKPHGIPIQDIATLPLRPWEVEHKTLTATTAVLLQYKPVLASELKLLPSTLAGTATTPYVKDTDYEFTEATASLVRTSSGSNITSGQVVKAFYKTGTKSFLTFPGNLVLGLSEDITITPFAYPLADGTFYIIRAKVGHTMMLPEANVLIKNIKAEPQAAA